MSKEPYALVDEAIARVLDGRRKWRSDDPPHLYNFLCGVMRSIVSADRKHDARTPLATEDASSVVPTQPVTAENLCESKELVAAITACSERDPELRAFQDSVLDGAASREEIANDLGVESDTVSVIRRRFQRQLVAQSPELFFEKRTTRGRR